MVSGSLKDNLNLLYDGYDSSYPFKKNSLGQADAISGVPFDQWGFFYPTGSFRRHLNRRRKSEKQSSAAKSTKEALQKVPPKEELLDW